jgi:nitroreductase
MLAGEPFLSCLLAREDLCMELYDVMRTTFAARAFTDDPLPDATLFKILENARFAPSGGNRQGWYVIIVRDHATRAALAACTTPAARRYVAQQQAGESPWNSINPTHVDEATVARTPVPARLIEPVLRAAVVLVICVDLQVVASTDQYLDRVGIISGASIYPFAWNILLAARHEGYGGTLTTLAVAQEPEIQALLGLPAHVAVCAVLPLGKPSTRLSRLSRKAVPAFAMHERWGGTALTHDP